MTAKEVLAKFRVFELSLAELKAALGVKGQVWPRLPESEIETIQAHDVVCAIAKYQSGDISQDGLLDWVNTVWFSDYFEYADEQCDVIASVMTELETLDEEGACFISV